MKLVYQNWNRDNVNDLTIKQDLESLSNGQLQLDDDSDLDSLTKSTARRQTNQPTQQSRPNNGGRNFKRHGQNPNYKNFKKNR
jgi:hypothetical protein